MVRFGLIGFVGAVHAGRVGVAGRGYGYRPIPGRPGGSPEGSISHRLSGGVSWYGVRRCGGWRSSAGAAYYNGYYNRCYYDAYGQWVCPQYQYWSVCGASIADSMPARSH
jgi:hypothetical protein